MVLVSSGQQIIKCFLPASDLENCENAAGK